jgi:hypothetical protein
MRFTQTIFSEFEKRWPVTCFCWLFLFLNQNLKYNTNMKLVKYIVLIGAVCAAFTLQPAKADVFTSSLDIGNSALQGFLTPGEEFGTVTVTVVGTTATILFTANTAGGFQFIDGGAADVNLAFPSTATNIVDAQFKNQQSGKNINGFGIFDLVINNNDGSGSPVSTIAFDVTVPSGTLAANVLDTNSNGFDAAAHISVFDLVTGLPINVTGFAAEAPGAFHEPDGGATAMLLGLGLSGLGFVRRFVKR